MKYKRRGFIDRQCKGVGVGDFLSRDPRSLSYAHFARKFADVFEKNEKKNKTTSVYHGSITLELVVKRHHRVS